MNDDKRYMVKTMGDAYFTYFDLTTRYKITHSKEDDLYTYTATDGYIILSIDSDRELTLGVFTDFSKKELLEINEITLPQENDGCDIVLEYAINYLRNTKPTDDDEVGISVVNAYIALLCDKYNVPNLAVGPATSMDAVSYFKTHEFDLVGTSMDGEKITHAILEKYGIRFVLQIVDSRILFIIEGSNTYVSELYVLGDVGLERLEVALKILSEMELDRTSQEKFAIQVRDVIDEQLPNWEREIQKLEKKEDII